METPAQRGARLVGALEDLVAEEAAALRTHDFEAAAAIAERAGPVVEWLVMQPDAITPALRERLARVQADRGASAELLESEINQTREDLRQLVASRRRVAQIVPAYGGRTAPRSRLSVVG